MIFFSLDRTLSPTPKMPNVVVNGVKYVFTTEQIAKSGLLKDLAEVFVGGVDITLSSPKEPQPGFEGFEGFEEYHKFVTTQRGNYPSVIGIAHFLLDKDTTRRAAWKFYCGKTSEYFEWLGGLANDSLINELPVKPTTPFETVLETMPRDLARRPFWIDVRVAYRNRDREEKPSEVVNVERI